MMRHDAGFAVGLFVTVMALGPAACAGAQPTEAGAQRSERTIRLDDGNAGSEQAGGPIGSDAASSQASPDPTPLREAGSDQLAAGTYTTSVFEPGFTFTVDDGWYQEMRIYRIRGKTHLGAADGVFDGADAQSGSGD